ncbi:MAG TPA: HipA family kinase, partial [Candidatus Saccharimonadales bacterium]|nr:HipA family kinase [Candidatus Saccharimonadales bacterium]
GRNHPLLLGCEDDAGEKFEVVVKFRGREMTEKARSAELIAAQLADDLGLQTPQAAVVDVASGFETIIPEKELAAMVRNSPGSNFGSVHLGAGFTI